MSELVNHFKSFYGNCDTFSTDCPQKLWKIQKTCQVLIALSCIVGLLFLTGCGQGKGVERFKALPRGDTLVGKTEAEVRKTIGEPDIISKTPENRILWRYRPSWKVIPSPKDTLYVEFDNEKVTKAFQIK